MNNLVLLPLSLIFLLSALYIDHFRDVFGDEYVVQQGVVIDKETLRVSWPKGEVFSYFVLYQYSYGGRKFQKRDEVSYRFFIDLKKGGPINVSFSEFSPDRPLIGTDDQSLKILAYILYFLGLVVFVVMVRKTRLERKEDVK